ncbi:hypothetical protein SAMN04487988_11086 [Algoriphagus hitonicola]|uniref:Uncharacterized protein n=1 Tax=Algoriphagus hitonicola TaxID=435880 RepID=A0A1I2VPY9_9BACT|nr:hypothetical protein SAMN04487988_11086 [Algoriphagus hitonicola]
MGPSKYFDTYNDAISMEDGYQKRIFISAFFNSSKVLKLWMSLPLS